MMPTVLLLVYIRARHFCGIFLSGWLHVGHAQTVSIAETAANVPFSAHVYEGGELYMPPRAFLRGAKLYAKGKVREFPFHQVH